MSTSRALQRCRGYRHSWAAFLNDIIPPQVWRECNRQMSQDPRRRWSAGDAAGAASDQRGLAEEARLPADERAGEQQVVASTSRPVVPAALGRGGRLSASEADARASATALPQCRCGSAGVGGQCSGPGHVVAACGHSPRPPSRENQRGGSAAGSAGSDGGRGLWPASETMASGIGRAE